MAKFNDTPVDDRIADSRINVLELGVQEGDNIIDLHASTALAEVGLRLSIDEAKALIGSLVNAIVAASINDEDED